MGSLQIELENAIKEFQGRAHEYSVCLLLAWPALQQREIELLHYDSDDSSNDSDAAAATHHELNLGYAVHYGTLEIAQLMHWRGASVHGPQSAPNKPLHLAVMG